MPNGRVNFPAETHIPNTVKHFGKTLQTIDIISIVWRHAARADHTVTDLDPAYRLERRILYLSLRYLGKDCFKLAKQSKSQLPLQQHDQSGWAIRALMGSWHMKLQLLRDSLVCTSGIPCKHIPRCETCVVNARRLPPIPASSIRWKCPGRRGFPHRRSASDTKISIARIRHPYGADSLD